MLDWLASKMALTIAALIIIASMIGFFATQRSSFRMIELQNIADEIARRVDEVSSISGETLLVLMTFNESKNGVHLKRVVDGKLYRINITRTLVILRQEDIVVSSGFAYQVHLWKPEKQVYNGTELLENDGNSRKIEFLSGNDFWLKQKTIEVDGVKDFHTFIYKA